MTDSHLKANEFIIAPSILSADFCNLKRDCENMLECGADWLHVDVMDGHFVPNLTIGPPIISSLRKSFPSAFLDCHLMIENPELWVERIRESGASSITFHIEASTDPLRLLRRIRSLNCHAAIAIKPSTPTSFLTDDILVESDMILIMTVEPGFGGQKLMENCIEKVRELRFDRGFEKKIQVDGGVGPENIKSLQDAGAVVFVAGSSLFNSPDPKATISLMKSKN